MSKISHSVLLQTTAIYLLALVSKATSQIVGCDTVGCGKQCALGNVTASSIGITSFNTSLSSEPLTWTVGVSTDYVPEDSSNATYERAYFLGTPPDLNLATSTSRACALFFEGVSPTINSTDGTCGDALGSTCARDLLSQAQNIMSGLSARSTNTTGGSCEQLMEALQAAVPTSCSVASDESWGTISVRDLTSTDTPSVSQSSCQATTGTGYHLSLIDTYTESYEYDLTMLSQPFLMGTTPILTIFFSSASSSPEAHLSCLKVVPSTVKQNSTTSAVSPSSTSAASRTSNSFGLVAGMMILVCWCWNWML